MVEGPQKRAPNSEWFNEEVYSVPMSSYTSEEVLSDVGIVVTDHRHRLIVPKKIPKIQLPPKNISK